MGVKRWILGLGVAAVLVIGASGCGSSGETTQSSPQKNVRDSAPRKKLRDIKVDLDGREGPQDAGILIAQERGYFRDAGLQVTIYKPATPSRPVQYVTKGLVELAVSHQPQVVLAHEKGVPVVTVGSVVSEPTAAMIWLPKSKIGSIRELKGKTIGFPGLSFQKAFLQSILARAGLTLADVRLKTVGYETMPALVSGRVDAVFGGAWNAEGVELEKRGLKPVITRVQSLGIPSYEELVLIVRRDRLAQDRQLIHDFISAMDRGMAAAIEDPQAATDAVAAEARIASSAIIEAEVEATLPLLSRSGGMDASKEKRLVRWMHEEGMIGR
jgi:putative hydroxymethylpyrimidine transport system substrate-binding protein